MDQQHVNDTEVIVYENLIWRKNNSLQKNKDV